jgi:hypothetical protein
LAYINSTRGFHCDNSIDAVYFEQVHSLYYIPLILLPTFLLFEQYLVGSLCYLLRKFLTNIKDEYSQLSEKGNYTFTFLLKIKSL